MGFQGFRNIYTCRACGHHVVTFDADDGVTPFLIECTGANGCGTAMMQSSLYRVFDQNMRPSIEWYRPGRDDVVPGHLQAHVSQGGLLKRPFTGPNPPPAEMGGPRRVAEQGGPRG